MHPDFSSYEAYLERYRMFWSEEGDDRPPLLGPDEFRETFEALKKAYEAMEDLERMGKMDEASAYYTGIINDLENQLAIADASDNFRKRAPYREA
ncbi:hypothetical protein [Staphylospora marina]|uniref:hypothetical protein n=1 Tax=Staphylospora marina TaxID=2490858 RepID=UPI000F5C14B6|nr:hypothetical protein [Staphylospora marina]